MFGRVTRFRALANEDPSNNLPPPSPTVNHLKDDKVVSKRIKQWETLEFSPKASPKSTNIIQNGNARAPSQPNFTEITDNNGTRRSPRLANKRSTSFGSGAESDDENVFDDTFGQNENTRATRQTGRSVGRPRRNGGRLTSSKKEDAKSTVSFHKTAKSPSSVSRLPATPRFGSNYNPSKLSQEITISDLSSVSSASGIDDSILGTRDVLNDDSLLEHLEVADGSPQKLNVQDQDSETEMIDDEERSSNVWFSKKGGLMSSQQSEPEFGRHHESHMGGMQSEDEGLADSEDEAMYIASRTRSQIRSRSGAIRPESHAHATKPPQQEKALPTMIFQFIMFLITIFAAVSMVHYRFNIPIPALNDVVDFGKTHFTEAMEQVMLKLDDTKDMVNLVLKNGVTVDDVQVYVGEIFKKAKEWW
ncbi:hypothetical protein BKA69DRAFT_1121613 [Paraphysoderma sedebokerense]|nr:hypothetical protein BKA69DRAFT_1121613 [Paraphysoderma sedebokerense]